jgi:hypothetical protein
MKSLSFGILCLCLFLALECALSLISMNDPRVMQVIKGIAAGIAAILLAIGK